MKYKSLKAAAVALLAVPAILMATPANAATYSQNAFNAPATVASGASFNLVANISASPTQTVNDAKFCTRNVSNNVVAYTAPDGDDVVPNTGVTIRQNGITLPDGTYTSVPCLRVGTSGSYTEVGNRKTIVVGSSTPSPSPTPTVTPTVSPSPSPTPTATPTATPSQYPDATNTGVPAGTVLTNYTGPTNITTAGTVIDSKVITSSLTISASNVTIKNSRLSGGGGAYCVLTQSGRLSLEDSEITGGCENAIGFDGWTANRVEIRGTYGDGVKLGSNVSLLNSWVHDLAPANGAHADGGQVQGGINNTIVDHNTIDLGSTPNANAALFIAPDQGPNSNGPLTVSNNKLNGGNYIIFCVDGDNGRYLISNISFTGNRFGNTFQYGRSNVNVPITQSGNVVDSTGAPYTL